MSTIPKQAKKISDTEKALTDFCARMDSINDHLEMLIYDDSEYSEHP